MTRDEIQVWWAELLLEKIREVDYPSTDHLDLIEQSMPCDMVPEYLAVLIEKVERDRFPSIPLLRRIRRVAACLPRAEQHHGREEPA